MDVLLKRIQTAQLELAKEVDRICKKHKIKYILSFGTLLGAVRHSGFIPWDDDLDIGMLRSEYDRFAAVVSSELNKKYFFQTTTTDDRYGLPYAKLRINGTEFVEQDSCNVPCHNGIFIDIFPFDNVPSNKFQQLQHKMKLYLLMRIVLARKKYTVNGKYKYVKRFIYKVASIISSIRRIEYWVCRLDEEARRFNNRESNSVIVSGDVYGYKVIPKKWLEETKQLQFEDTMLNCPKDYDSYLTFYYGDYMTPPPEELRYNRHKVIKVDFGGLF